MSWSSELPSELLCRPMGLVALTGLDATYNAIHKSIWDSFCNNRRGDRVPLKFKLQEGDHEYPKCRSKRTSYEWYIPKGILKTGWMNKHLQQVPAVVVVFFDLDWDENLWKEKQMECATRVEIVRNSLQGRGTRVAVVLIQKNAPLPPGEDVVAAERAASLCSACELSAKSLFVLPHTDHLYGYTIRLENAYYELAQSYYHTEARRVKAHKEFLNKTTHQLLFVRHQFKIAFFNELKQDTHTALKHYKQAYGHLLELRMHDTNLLEIKTNAGFINYKICRLSFQHNAPLDAIAQFRKHIDFFKNKGGTPELAFENSAWMSKQFQVFGDLFDEAIKAGLTAIQTQHPGFYYQQAANHAIARKQLCRGLCHPLATIPSPDPLELLNNLDYYGQRPWRQGHQSIDPPDALKERDGIQALQNMELKVDHSWQIIPLLSSAVAQFKKYKSPRMKRFLMVQMGEEYFHARDYHKALTLLSRVTWDYRNERWWGLLTNILTMSLRCAYLVASIQEYVTISLELIGKYAQCSPDERTRIQVNLIRAMSGDPPESELGCNPDCVEKAKPLWKDVPKDACVFTVEMQNIIPFVECKAHFVDSVFTADTLVSLQVHMRVSCQFPIRFSKLSILLSNPHYNQFCVISDGLSISASSSTASEDQSEASDLYLTPGHVKSHTFNFLAHKDDVGKYIEINSIALELGTESRCAVLHWSGGGGAAVTTPATQQLQHQGKAAILPSKEDIDWEQVENTAAAKIEARTSQMEVELVHEMPCLVNEFYHVQIKLKNLEESQITSVSLSFGLQEGEDQSVEQSTHVSVDKAEFDGKVVSRKMGIGLGKLESGEEEITLEPGSKYNKEVYIKCLQTGPRVLHTKVSYDVTVKVGEENVTCTCHCETTTSLQVIDPFNTTLKLASLKCERLEAVHADEPFLLLAELKCTSPWQLDIQNSEIALSSHVRIVGEPLPSQLANVVLKEKDGAAECFCLEAPACIQTSISLGSYVIHWRRKSADETTPFVTTTIDLPSVNIEHVPLLVDMDLPSHGCVRQALPVSYTIYNRTAYVQEVEINMEPSEAFMFAGHKQVHFRILPSSKYKLHYAFYPLFPGHVCLPTLHFNMLRYPGTMDPIVQKMLPSHVFIKPSGKNIEDCLLPES